MPSASELERERVEAEEPTVSFWRARSAEMASKSYRLKERLAIWIAWKLPKRIALWAMIRVAAHATTGPWGGESPSGLTYGQMHDRWNIDND